MKSIKNILTTIALWGIVIGAQAQNTAQSDRFSGEYKAIDEEGNVVEEMVEIFYKDGAYYFWVFGEEGYKTTLSADGNILTVKTEVLAKINDDGSVEVELEADVRLFYEKDNLIYEKTIPDMGTYKYTLKKI